MTRCLFIFLAVIGSLATLRLDFDRLHVFNPEWPAHARFHAAAYAILNTLCCLVALFLAAFMPLGKLSVQLSGCLLIIVALTFFLALIVPGTSPVASPNERKFKNTPISVWMAAVFLFFVVAGLLNG